MFSLRSAATQSGQSILEAGAGPLRAEAEGEVLLSMDASLQRLQGRTAADGCRRGPLSKETVPKVHGEYAGSQNGWTYEDPF